MYPELPTHAAAAFVAARAQEWRVLLKQPCSREIPPDCLVERALL